MFGIGFPEMILILALALIVVGPDKLPDMARSIAKTIMDLKKTAEGLKENLNIEENPLSEIKPELEDAAKNFKETILDAETQTWKKPDSSQTPDVDGAQETLKEQTLPDHLPKSENKGSLDEADSEDFVQSPDNQPDTPSADSNKPV